MCGIVAVVGSRPADWPVEDAVRVLRHRGPDAGGVWTSSSRQCVLGNRRLSIIDLSPAGNQPISFANGRFHLTLNGEIYNYKELRRELEGEFSFRTETDSEVLLAAYAKWGAECLHRLIGMFAFALWDEREHELFVARDRLGVKPLYFAQLTAGTWAFASEVKALHRLGIARESDLVSWSTYLGYGQSDLDGRSFWEGVRSLPPGHSLRVRSGRLTTRCWYDLEEKVTGAVDERPVEEVREEYESLLRGSMALRFRSDVPVGIALSGGLDSSLLLALVREMEEAAGGVDVFTFITGDERYDELPWVRRALEGSGCGLHVCSLAAEEVPDLAKRSQWYQDEPFGGIPTLAYGKVFARARSLRTPVLLDGQGLDEQWAGYDYYQRFASPGAGLEDAGRAPDEDLESVQGTADRATRPGCLNRDFLTLAEPTRVAAVGGDRLRQRQLQDIRHNKIPRALRFNDRASMMHGVELREPFLDHRLFEVALRQPVERKIRDGEGKWLLRRIAESIVPHRLAVAPKRPVQTPQREWLRGPLKSWAEERITAALAGSGSDWLRPAEVWREWRSFCDGMSHNSFYVWQWISIGLIDESVGGEPR